MASSKPYKKILYVDDQPSHGALFEKAFGRDYEVTIAHSAKEALDIIAAEKPFLVLADHNMPEMSGIELLEIVRQEHPEMIRAILSAYTDEKILLEALKRADIFEFLTKPWKLKDVARFLKEAHEQFLWATPPTLLQRTQKTDRVVEAPGPFLWERFVTRLGEFDQQLSDRQVAYLLQTYGRKNMEHGFHRINRPLPESLKRAEEEAAQGNLEEMNKALFDYLQLTLKEGILGIGDLITPKYNSSVH